MRDLTTPHAESLDLSRTEVMMITSGKPETP